MISIKIREKNTAYYERNPVTKFIYEKEKITMENIEVMSNEFDEVIEVAEMITPKSNKGLKMVGSVGAVALAGFGIYKGIKWIKAKRQAKKEAEEIEATCEPDNECCKDESK